MKYPSKYFVRHVMIQDNARDYFSRTNRVVWQVWRANIGGDTFFIDEYSTEDEAKARVIELQEEG